jgi:hypothetical protein
MIQLLGEHLIRRDQCDRLTCCGGYVSAGLRLYNWSRVSAVCAIVSPLDDRAGYRIFEAHALSIDHGAIMQSLDEKWHKMIEHLQVIRGCCCKISISSTKKRYSRHWCTTRTSAAVILGKCRSILLRDVVKQRA